MFNATSIHEWAKYIPETQKEARKDDFIVKVDNKLSLKITLGDIGLDYTP